MNGKRRQMKSKPNYNHQSIFTFLLSYYVDLAWEKDRTRNKTINCLDKKHMYMEILKCSKVNQEYLLDVQRGGRNIVIQLFHHINEEATDLSPMPENPPDPDWASA